MSLSFDLPEDVAAHILLTWQIILHVISSSLLFISIFFFSGSPTIVMWYLILLTSYSVFYMSCLLLFIHSRSLWVTERWKVLVDAEIEYCKVLCIVVFSLLPVDHKSCLTFMLDLHHFFFLFCFMKEENRAVLPLKHFSFSYIKIRPLKAIQSWTHYGFLFLFFFSFQYCTSGRNFDSVYCQQSYFKYALPPCCFPFVV